MSGSVERIAEDLQRRLGQLRDEASRLEAALQALNGAEPPRRRRHRTRRSQPRRQRLSVAERRDQIIVIAKTHNEGQGIPMAQLSEISGLGKPRLAQLVRSLIADGKLTRPARGVIAPR